MDINDPAVIAELTHCHEVYEKALIASDTEKLDDFFWDSSHAIHLGVAENLHGADEIRAFRQAHPNIELDREIERLDIMSFGDSIGIVNLELKLAMFGVERDGRETQFWIRFPEGWKIVSAHVSLLPAPPSYLEAASAEIGLSIDRKEKAAVNGDLNRIAAIAGFLMEFPLSQGVEAAPQFEP
jgi:Protein of unknown function (DUF3225)/Protein of unknown function (DUF4089)